MAVLLHPLDRADEWFAAISAELPDIDVRMWPDVGDPDDIECAVLSVHDGADLRRYRNLKAILSMGAGIEQFTTPDMPDVTIVRLVDPAMSDEMAVYALHWVSHFQRGFDRYLDVGTVGNWEPSTPRSGPDMTVGILGFGNIGARVGRVFSDLGYQVAAWSRTGRTRADDVRHHAGIDELDAFLASCDAVVNVLPSTANTNGLLDRRRFEQMGPGAGFINMGRGATVDEAAVMWALDVGHLAYAVLDVTQVEPLPASSPLWSHPGVTITPHVAGITVVATAAPIIAANIRRVLAGDTPHPVYDRTRGY